MLFRIPLYFLTQSSTYFADFFKDRDVGSVVCLTEDDVSGTSFANLLSVLRPPYVLTVIYESCWC
jgi:hypothetical protein